MLVKSYKRKTPSGKIITVKSFSRSSGRYKRSNPRDSFGNLLLPSGGEKRIIPYKNPAKKYRKGERRGIGYELSEKKILKERGVRW